MGSQGLGTRVVWLPRRGAPALPGPLHTTPKNGWFKKRHPQSHVSTPGPAMTPNWSPNWPIVGLGC